MLPLSPVFLNIPGVEDHRADLVEGIIEFAFQEPASLTADLSCSCRVVDRDVVVGYPHKVAAIFLMLPHHHLRSSRLTTLVGKPKRRELC